MPRHTRARWRAAREAAWGMNSFGPVRVVRKWRLRRHRTDCVDPGWFPFAVKSAARELCPPGSAEVDLGFEVRTRIGVRQRFFEIDLVLLVEGQQRHVEALDAALGAGDDRF